MFLKTVEMRSAHGISRLVEHTLMTYAGARVVINYQKTINQWNIRKDKAHKGLLASCTDYRFCGFVDFGLTFGSFRPLVGIALTFLRSFGTLSDGDQRWDIISFKDECTLPMSRQWWTGTSNNLYYIIYIRPLIRICNDLKSDGLIS